MWANSNWVYACFFFSIYSYANIYLNFVKVTLGNKFLFNFSRGNFVNSSFYTSFINGKNEEIWVKMLSYIAEPNARTFTQCYIKHLEILSSLLFCVNLILLYSYEWVNIPLKATPLHRRVNLVHFKAGLFGAQWNIQWNWHAEWPWTKNCLLELNIQMIWIMLHFESYN